VITFLTDGDWENEFMYLFTADSFEGTLSQCDEGNLEWVKRDFIQNLPQWEGDKIFLDLLWQDAPFFLLKLRYHGDKLVEAVLNGEKIR
jgi:8-oxo-dGTP diphosphatase